MSVKIWHNPSYLDVQLRLDLEQPIKIPLASLELIAIANTDDISKAWTLTQAISQMWEQPWITTIKTGRRTTNGDVLQTEDNYWLIAFDQFLPLAVDPNSKYLTPVIFKQFEFEGFLELEETFAYGGFFWMVVDVLEYDLQANRSTVVACQGPPTEKKTSHDHCLPQRTIHRI